MRRIAAFAVASVVTAVVLNGSVFEPAGWALVLAGVAGAGLFGNRRKPPIGMDT